MESSQDELQLKINEAREFLSKESREAIDAVDWKSIILGMNNKYNMDQLEYLEIETELLLCGLLNPEDYPQKLENEMRIPKEEVEKLIKELDELIFKKIQTELEKRLVKTEITSEDKRAISEKVSPAIDPRFSNLPKEVQEAIIEFDWKGKLYEIASKYKLNIEQMGILEDITTKVMLNTIHPDKYEVELASKIIIPKEDIANIIKDVNEGIFQKIREGEKVITNNQPARPHDSSGAGGLPIINEKIITTEEKIPLPPYKKVVTNDQLLITDEKEETNPVEKTNTINPMEEKLKSATVSEHTISDHSTPSAKTSDPYREAF